MKHTIDKAKPDAAPTKTKELKKVKGYVAPTETGTIRTVRTHEKLVEVDAKEEKQQNAKPEIKLNGAQTIGEAATKIAELNKAAREANFTGDTHQVTEATLGFYRGGVNASADPRLDEKDGLRNVLDEMRDSLHSIGFDNKYNLTAHQAIVKMTSPTYMRTLANKASVVEKRINEAGLETQRLDPFTVAIDHEDGNRVYVSNNPLDLITANKINKVNESNGNIMAAVHQDKMNDFVFFTADKIDGGSKTASAVATYDPKTRRFFHYNDIHPEIKPVLKGKLNSKKTLHDSNRSLAEIEM